MTFMKKFLFRLLFPTLLSALLCVAACTKNKPLSGNEEIVAIELGVWAHIDLGINDGYAVAIDWGNGVLEQVMEGCLGFTYANDSSYTVRIYGNTEAIFSIVADSEFIVNVDVSKSRQLKYLHLSESGTGQLKSLDLSGNPHLESLSFTNCPLPSLNLSKNPLLKTLICSGPNLTSLDVSKNPLLETLDCSYAQLSSLDVSRCPHIETVLCYENPFLLNRAATVAFAQSLPDRTGLSPGHVSPYLGPAWLWIQSICAAKNWN